MAGAIPLKCVNQIQLMENQGQELNLKAAPWMCKLLGNDSLSN